MTLVRLRDQVLPAPGRRDLPEPKTLRAMLGPGIILAGLSIGSGEFVLWPRLTAEWGLVMFWACWIGVSMQFFMNMEIERYTLATGESAVIGFVRLSRSFGPIFLVCGTLPWIWPGWASGAATLLSWEIGGPVTLYAVGGLFLCGLLLSLGPVVYRTVEGIQIGLVTVIFVLLVGLAIVVVRGEALLALASGALRVGHIPEGIDLPLLLGALAFAGAGGTVNLAQSNYIRDKGYGMGRWMGRLTSPFTGREESTGETGFVFEGDPENLARWRVWWRRANLEHALTFYLLSLLSLALFCLITYSLFATPGEVSPGFGFIQDQAGILGERYGALAQHCFVWGGIAVLFSTELALLDAVSRVVADLVKVTFLSQQHRWSLSRLYFAFLWGFILFGVAILAVGLTQPLQLLIVSASLNAIVMFLYSGLLLVLNLNAFRPPIRPGWSRIAALVAAFGFFGYFSFLTIGSQIQRLTG
ncbi:MAG: Nramp family divalent metal transporter [Myxococcota bacterium]